MWSKGRKLARENIKALKERLEAADNPIELAAFDTKSTLNDIYKGAFTQVKAGDPDYYNDVTVDEMIAELAKPTHVPWFQQAYDKYVDGQRFASQIPDTRTYTGLTLGTRNQPDKLSALQRNTVNDTNRFLTKDMRDAGLKAPPVMYVPQDEIDYYMQTGQLPKALAANVANADLQGIRVPIRQDDGSFKDLQGDVMGREDMAGYFARLRAAPAQTPSLVVVPPPPVVEESPVSPGPIRNKQHKYQGKERNKQL